MIKHINKVEEYIFQNYGKKLTRLKSDKSFDYYMFEHVKTRGKNKGEKGYGWATMRCRWCTTLLKTRVIDNYLKNLNEDYIEYVGIAVDEEQRIGTKQYPLVEWNMTEADCLKYCYDLGFNWDGLYEHFDRLSCWCCPMKNQKELKILWEYYPDLWAELKDMDKRAYNEFKRGHTVEDLEDKFRRSHGEKQIE